MTREEFRGALSDIDEGGRLSHSEEARKAEILLLDHDKEQRAEVARLKNDLSHWTFVRFQQLESENKRLREALTEIIEKCEDEGWEYMFGDVMDRAKDALKEEQ